MDALFTPIQLGPYTLANRIVMAPLTRNRAVGRIVNDLTVKYYAQRANPDTGAALIISEASQICPMGQGYLDTPGIYTPDQVAAWKKVTDAVHAQSGRIVIQLWHVGRVSNSSLLPDGAAPVSSTARRAQSKTYTADGFQDVSQPRALATDELPGVVDSYRLAARNAIEAGFDGVEVHAANGYLIEQFLRDSINDRTDAYGGSIENRTRLLREVMVAVTQEIGAERTAIRLSPVTPANDAGQDSQPQALYEAAVQSLPSGLLYVHVVEGQTGGARDFAPFDYAALRRQTSAPWMVNNGYTREMALDVVARGEANLVAFGRPFAANPDLGTRLRLNAPWNAVDAGTLYGGGAKGYTDYPLWTPSA